MRISTLFAVLRGKLKGLRTRAQKHPNLRSLNWLLALIKYSMRECEYGSTTASIQMRGRTAVDSRYDMRAQTCYAVKRRAARAAVHELEFAVGGDERDGAVDIEARETHASAKGREDVRR